MTEKKERTFAELLDYLFREVRPKGRGSFTYAEVAEGIRASSGVTISASGIQQLRTGKNSNPKFETVRALALLLRRTPRLLLRRGDGRADAGHDSGGRGNA